MSNNKENERKEEGRIRHIIEKQEKVKPWPDPPKENGGGGEGQGGQGNSGNQGKEQD